MLEYLLPIGMLVGAFVGAILLVTICVGGFDATRRLPNGLLHYYFYSVLLSNCIAVLVSSRQFTADVEITQTVAVVNPIASWAIRLASVFALLAAGDQIVRRIGRNLSIEMSRLVLLGTFVVFWTTNIAVPAVLGAHHAPLEVGWIYSLVLGSGMILMSNETARASILTCRFALVAVCAVSLLLIPVRPHLVLEFDYTQGYLPGVPRFAGLAPHAIIMGMIAALALMMLVAYPFASKRINWLSWGVGLLTLFLAQSKTVWISLMIAIVTMMYYQRGLPTWNDVTDPRRRVRYTILGGLAAVLILAIAGLTLSGTIANKLAHFAGSQEGAQVLSFTGRDKIWEAALFEWRRYPVFGYGLPLFGEDHRAEIGMSFATSGHNQFIDSLARSGLVGCAGTIVHVLLLLWLGIRFARNSRGLSAALAISIVVRMISEVPITLTKIGIDTLPYYLLLAVIAAGYFAERAPAPARQEAGRLDRQYRF